MPWTDELAGESPTELLAFTLIVYVVPDDKPEMVYVVDAVENG